MARLLPAAGPASLAVAALAIACALLWPAGGAGAASLEERFERLQSQQSQEALERNQRIEALVKDLSAGEASRERAYRELLFYADEPALTGRLLDLLRSSPAPAAADRALRLLSESAASSWTRERLDEAEAVLDRLGGAQVDGAELERFAGHLDKVRAELAPERRQSYGVVQSRGMATEALTDIDIFTCEGAGRGVLRPAHALAERLAGGDFGQVRLREADRELEAELKPEPGRTTVVFDAKHPEAKEVGRVERAVKADDNLPPFAAIPNRSSSSYWYLSVFVCP